MILQLQMREIQLQQILVSHSIIMQGKLPIRIGFTAEKLTPSADSEHQDTLVITVPRFAPSAVMLISTIVNNTQAPFYVDQDSIEYRDDYVKYNGSNFITAIYDQRGTQSSSSNEVISYTNPVLASI
jgi:hypothetical protein